MYHVLLRMSNRSESIANNLSKTQRSTRILCVCFIGYFSNGSSLLERYQIKHHSPLIYLKKYDQAA